MVKINLKKLEENINKNKKITQIQQKYKLDKNKIIQDNLDNPNQEKIILKNIIIKKGEQILKIKKITIEKLYNYLEKVEKNNKNLEEEYKKINKQNLLTNIIKKITK